MCFFVFVFADDFGDEGVELEEALDFGGGWGGVGGVGGVGGGGRGGGGGGRFDLHLVGDWGFGGRFLVDGCLYFLLDLLLLLFGGLCWGGGTWSQKKYLSS